LANNIDWLSAKNDLIATCNSRGWALAMQIAEQIAQEATDKLLTCSDDNQVLAFQRKAQASREFLNTFLRRVEEFRQLEVTDENSFVEVMTG
jgi:hypothetical protein